jgi:hypothetical protein
LLFSVRTVVRRDIAVLPEDISGGGPEDDGLRALPGWLWTASTHEKSKPHAARGIGTCGEIRRGVGRIPA